MYGADRNENGVGRPPAVTQVPAGHGRGNDGTNEEPAAQGGPSSPPAISLPKGGGAIRGMGEKFSANPVTGTASLSVPIYTSPGRSGFHPELSLSYDSGAGNGAFGFGWSLSVPSITRKTDKGLPRYLDEENSDTFILSGAEDLVPRLVPAGEGWTEEALPPREEEGERYEVHRYRPRIEGLFARIERWVNARSGEVHWRSVSKDNVRSLYGKSPDGRISDPADASRVFQWLLEETSDDKGNVTVYEYKRENPEGVDGALPQEKNRLTNGGSNANRYLKRIKYGNKTPYERADWLFEMVFDYGEHDPENPTVEEAREWPCRLDAFSGFRAGFETRTYRLCRRVLMFHRFSELGTEPYLVRSTDLDYAEGPLATYLRAVSQTGYVRKDGTGAYRKRSMPPLEFAYTEPRVDEEVREIDAESLENLPVGLDGGAYQWLDLESEGLSGILSEQADAWLYKRNLGDGRFAPAELVAAKPAIANLAGGHQQLMDLAGDGRNYLVQFGDPLPGYHEREDGGWGPFNPFLFRPNISWNDPNLKFVDLTGDGHADLLISEDEVFVWYPSRAREGFGPPEVVTKPYDEEKGPTLVFVDGTQSVYLADMCGDGLTDIVRIRNGEVCYWPNLGYGRFGAKVTMDAAPLFDYPDQFEGRRIRLADIDGSGVTDIVYLGAETVSYWLNQSGNSWSAPHRLTQFPPTDDLSSVMVVDLLGNGTACLVWSSPLPGDSSRPMRYVDLMGGMKPHLLKSVKNNLGAETRVGYASSTRFYLEDRASGKPWITKLPFPVHVVERVEARDGVSDTKLVTLYRYHHGYYDGEEREFRGFGLVEQWDTEASRGSPTVWNCGRSADGSQPSRYLPVDIGGLPEVVDLKAGGPNLALTSEGAVWAWGDNSRGQLGDGTTVSRTTPVRVRGENGEGFLADVKAVAAGNEHCLALTFEGRVLAWGANAFGQLGNGTTDDRLVPTEVSGLSGVTDIAAGKEQGYALKSDGTVWAWGFNSPARLGDGTGTNRSTPVQVRGENGEGFLTDVKAIAAGAAHCLALKSDGTVLAWGVNQWGALGDGGEWPPYRHAPVRVRGENGEGFLADVRAVASSANSSHSLALGSDGTVWAWGANDTRTLTTHGPDAEHGGQLGDGTKTQRNSPVRVRGLAGIEEIAGGGAHSLALDSDGTLWAWGANLFGQLGDGTTEDRLVPIRPGGPNGAVAAIAAHVWGSLVLAKEELRQPPVHTKTWFHTGAYLDRQNISKHFEDQYYGGDPQAVLLPDIVLPTGLNAQEEREACRALKGSVLRQEVYARDGSARSEHPYSVSERNYTIEAVQPLLKNRHAVFFAHPREAVTYHYERNPRDPRVGHEMTLEVDRFGNVTKSAAIGYGRRSPGVRLSGQDGAKQTRTLITYTESAFTNGTDTQTAYRAPLPCETRTYELTGLPQAGNDLFTFEALLEASKAAAPVAYEDVPRSNTPQKRSVEHVRTLYRKDDLSGPLPLGQVEPLALSYEGYRLAFTPGLLARVYGDRIGETLLRREGGYLKGADYEVLGLFPATDEDALWWIPSGRSFFSPDTSAPELPIAREHFYLPHRFEDPFGNTSRVVYDPHDLLIEQTEDAVGNVVRAKNHYRTVAPQLVTDPNGNRSGVRFDALGMVVGTFVMGKPGLDEGDFFDETSDEASSQDDPTTRLEYELFEWADHGRPNFVHTFAREQHGAANPRWQESYGYSDGFGREIQKKVQAEPGSVVEDGPAVDPRWVGTGWTIFNNKGKPVKQYEPFFTGTAAFEFAERRGVSSTLFYDPLDRVVATLHPNHTYEKVVFDPWEQTSWDVNDTVLLDPRTDEDVRGYMAAYIASLPGSWKTWLEERIPGLDPANPPPSPTPEQAAAIKAAAHANTPAVAYLDTLGRTFLTVADDGVAADGTPRKYETRVELDIEGNQRSITDARGLKVMEHEFDVLGNKVHLASMDAGERRALIDAAGRPIRVWDSRGHTVSTTYDALGRPTRLFVQEQGTDPAVLAEYTVYGEALGETDSKRLNLRGKPYQHYDGAGVATSEEYDFKGNPLRGSRRLAKEYRRHPDWSALADLTDAKEIADAAAPSLEAEPFASSTSYDALNRPTSLITPDGSETRPAYNEANLLEKVDVRLRGAEQNGQPVWTPFVRNIDYDAKGQRQMIEYGVKDDSGSPQVVRTQYAYDPLTFRLTNLKTTRTTDNRVLQDLGYTYDPVGNITEIRDGAQQTVFFDNAVVRPHAHYTYDALYRLVLADGREHAGQNANAQVDEDDSPRTNRPLPTDGQAMRRYTEEYLYDGVGNILSMAHKLGDAPGGEVLWKRRYDYDSSSNRLMGTSRPGDPDGTFSQGYRYDAHGNMTSMPHLAEMQWDFKDQLQAVDLGGGGKAYYVYDTTGQRVRKVVERQGGSTEERIYLGGYEVFRQRSGGNLKLERQTLHVMDDKRRVAMAETKTRDKGKAVASPKSMLRYQLDNHLGSACLELDEGGAVITYEEFYPYGSTSYQAVRSGLEVSVKRYRYTGKERDEESGLYYHGARYYASWLGRWCSCDPIGIADGTNVYRFVRNNPIGFSDRDGQQSSAPADEERYNRATAQAGYGTRVALRGTAPVGGAPHKSFRLSAKPLAGTYHLWSDETTGKPAAKAAITPKKPGYIMGQTPEHVKAEASYKAAMKRSGGAKLPKPEHRGYWDPPSEKVAARATAAEHPVATHGPENLESVQMRVERPTVKRAGTLSGTLTVVSGAANISAATQSDDATVKAIGVTGGTVEVAGGVAYAVGALKVGTPAATKLMQVGSQLSRFGGGVAGGVVSGHALAKDIDRGDVTHGVGNAAGTATGVLTIVGASSAAAVTGAFSAGYAAGTLVNEHVLSEETKDVIGGTLNEIVNEGGWREIYKHPFGIGL